MPYAEVNGQRIRFEDSGGDGPAVIFEKATLGYDVTEAAKGRVVGKGRLLAHGTTTCLIFES